MGGPAPILSGVQLARLNLDQLAAYRPVDARDRRAVVTNRAQVIAWLAEKTTPREGDCG
jgi:hypothetical protein